VKLRCKAGSVRLLPLFVIRVLKVTWFFWPIWCLSFLWRKNGSSAEENHFPGLRTLPVTEIEFLYSEWRTYLSTTSVSGCVHVFVGCWKIRSAALFRNVGDVWKPIRPDLGITALRALSDCWL
jgi:hypothetical protein